MVGTLIKTNFITNKVKITFFLSYHLCIFFSLCSWQILISKTSNKDILKNITASSLRFGQLKEDGE